MNEGRIHTTLLVLIALLCGYFVLFGKGSIKEANKLTRTMKSQIDSMQVLATRYERIHSSYVRLHDDLSQTRNRVENLKKKLEDISNSNISSVSAIKRRLNEVIMAYDSIDYRLNPTGSNDDLIFD